MMITIVTPGIITGTSNFITMSAGPTNGRIRKASTAGPSTGPIIVSFVAPTKSFTKIIPARAMIITAGGGTNEPRRPAAVTSSAGCLWTQGQGGCAKERPQPTNNREAPGTLGRLRPGADRPPA